MNRDPLSIIRTTILYNTIYSSPVLDASRLYYGGFFLSMLHSIVIPQKEALQSGKSLNIQELAIYSYMSNYCIFNPCLEFKHKKFYQITCEKIMEALPIFEFTKEDVLQHIETLERECMIERLDKTLYIHFIGFRHGNAHIYAQAIRQLYHCAE